MLLASSICCTILPQETIIYLLTSGTIIYHHRYQTSLCCSSGIKAWWCKKGHFGIILNNLILLFQTHHAVAHTEKPRLTETTHGKNVRQTTRKGDCDSSTDVAWLTLLATALTPPCHQLVANITIMLSDGSMFLCLYHEETHFTPALYTSCKITLS